MFFSLKKLLASCLLVTFSLSCVKAELRWDWSGVNLSDERFFEHLALPADFIFGIADSAYQTEGAEGPGGVLIENSWTVFEKQRKLTPAGKGCQRWTRFESDHELIKQSGFQEYRFSIEWSKVEPQKGVFNQEAIDHYKAVCQDLVKRGIKPIVMLFHHTWPCWFDQMAGFEKEKNVGCFVEYAQRMFKELSPWVKTWMTFNEPEGYAMQAYFRGEYPPAKKDLALTGEVIKNMLKAHVRCYDACKKNDPESIVGFTKIVQHIDPYSWRNPLEAKVSSSMDFLFNDAILNFFINGKFEWSDGGKAWGMLGYKKTLYCNSKAPQSLDFIGINYYTHTILKFPAASLLAPALRPGVVASDDKKAIYPEGLYRAIERCAALKKPIYITENGIADKNDIYRDMYIKQHLYAVKQALDDGFDVRGYHYWTLLDNFEWSKGYSECYGLYKVDRATQKRTMRQGSRQFITYLQRREKL